MLIAQIVGKNESGRYLDQILSRLANQVDAICFTDDCSDDDTFDIAREYTAHAMRLDESLFSTNESALRSNAWQFMVESVKPVEGRDWILAIDCDEQFYHQPDLTELLEQDYWHVLGVKFFHMWNQTEYRIDKAWAPTVSSRLFRYVDNGAWHQRALACGAEPLYVRDMIAARRFLHDTNLQMKHLGYIRDDDKLAKYERYMTLDGGDFHALRHIESIVDQDPTLVEWNYPNPKEA